MFEVIAVANELATLAAELATVPKELAVVVSAAATDAAYDDWRLISVVAVAVAAL